VPQIRPIEQESDFLLAFAGRKAKRPQVDYLADSRERCYNLRQDHHLDAAQGECFQ